MTFYDVPWRSMMFYDVLWNSMVYECKWIVQEWPNDPTAPGYEKKGKGKGKSKSSVASKGSTKGKMNGIASFLAEV